MLSESIAVRMYPMTIKCYSELVKISSFEKRFDYLKLNGNVGESTFGFDRYLNQLFYKSKEWRAIRDKVIIRDNGCDLGVEGYDVRGTILIHHMNPISVKDIEFKTDILLDPEYLICVTHKTHNAIHYSNMDLLSVMPNQRTRNDTCPWKK